MNRLFLFLITFAILCGPLTAQTDITDDSLPSPADTLQFPLIPSEQIWFYGFIPKDAWVSHHYRLYNPHDDTVTITKMVPGCDCTHLPQAPIAVAPGETYLLKSRFDTRTYSGELNRDIRITTDFEPSPELYLYFISLTASEPRTLSVTPQSTMFIKGKESQTFTIKNLMDKQTAVAVFVDHDSSLTVSDHKFDIRGNKEYQFTVKPVWDKIERGQHYTCIVLEITREEEIFRVSIPIKTTLF